MLANLALGCRAVGRGRGRWLLWGTAIVAVLVLAEEVSQIWIPSRSFDLLDLSADAVGIVAGDLLARRLNRFAPGRSAARAMVPIEGKGEGGDARPSGERTALA